MRLSTQMQRRLLVGLTCFALGACSGVPKEVESLEQARLDYSQASQNTLVVRHAPELLDKAQDALQEAEIHWQASAEVWRIEHYAYLASQRVATATLIAESEETESEIQEMVLERRALNDKLRDAELLKVRKEASDLKRQMSALQAVQTDRGMMWTLGDVLFDVDKAKLAPSSARNIAHIASFMRKHPEKKALIEGHADNAGTDSYNMDLSSERAVAVRDALVDTGIDSGRLSIQGFGEKRPVANNTSMVGRQANRRVEVIFPDDGVRLTEFEE